MNKISILCLLAFAHYAQAQVSPNDPCAYDFTTIVCKYDDNGNRIFRGFLLECPPDDRPATNTAPDIAKNAVSVATSRLILTAQIFPNPTVSETTLTFAEMPPAGAILYVYDAQGKILVEQYADAQQMRISLAPFPAATYLVSVLHKKQVLYNGKIIKTDR